jgi:DNA-binding Lrp family transcriptional regulator
MIVDALNQQLLTLLKGNCRTSTSELARQLGVSRTTVQDRILRLEKKHIIAGYTVVLHKEYTRRLIQAKVMIQINPKLAGQIGKALRQLQQIKTLQAVSGPYDLIAEIAAETTEEIDGTLDMIGNVEGVEKTMSSIVLSTKFER